MPDPVTIANSSCLIALESISRLDLLRQLYGTVAVPQAVVAECGSSLPAWLCVQTVQSLAVFQSLRLQLGFGESEAIALAGELSAARVILDDKKARRIARQMGLPVTGTIAVLIQAKQHGFIPRVGDLLDQLSATGFFLTDALAEAARRQVGE
jgi:hypothetical protein